MDHIALAAMEPARARRRQVALLSTLGLRGALSLASLNPNKTKTKLRLRLFGVFFSGTGSASFQGSFGGFFLQYFVVYVLVPCGSVLSQSHFDIACVMSRQGQAI